MTNEQEKKKEYVAPVMEVIEFDCRQGLLNVTSNDQPKMDMVID